MRNIWNLLERYRFIENVEEWRYIRELRNEIAHDYALSENDVVSVLNELISKVSTLKAIYERLKKICLRLDVRCKLANITTISSIDCCWLAS